MLYAWVERSLGSFPTACVGQRWEIGGLDCFHHCCDSSLASVRPFILVGSEPMRSDLRNLGNGFEWAMSQSVIGNGSVVPFDVGVLVSLPR